MIWEMRISVQEQGIGEQSSSYFTLHPQGWSFYNVTRPRIKGCPPQTWQQCSAGASVLGTRWFLASWWTRTTTLSQHDLGNLCLTPHWTWKRTFARDVHVLDFLFLLTNQKPHWQMHLLTYVITAKKYSGNRTFLNWGRKENKIRLLSTQEKLMNSCKSTPKSEVLGLAFYGSENEWNFNWIQTFPCVHDDSIYYCNYKGQADASLLFKERHKFT